VCVCLFLFLAKSSTQLDKIKEIKHIEYYLSFHNVLVLWHEVMTFTLNVMACDRQYDMVIYVWLSHHLIVKLARI